MNLYTDCSIECLVLGLVLPPSGWSVVLLLLLLCCCCGRRLLLAPPVTGCCPMPSRTLPTVNLLLLPIISVGAASIAVVVSPAPAPSLCACLPPSRRRRRAPPPARPSSQKYTNIKDLAIHYTMFNYYSIAIYRFDSVCRSAAVPRNVMQAMIKEQSFQSDSNSLHCVILFGYSSLPPSHPRWPRRIHHALELCLYPVGHCGRAFSFIDE